MKLYILIMLMCLSAQAQEVNEVHPRESETVLQEETFESGSTRERQERQAQEFETGPYDSEGNYRIVPKASDDFEMAD